MEEHEAHVADNMAACAEFQEFKDECCMPPVLEEMFEDASFIDREGEDDE